MPVYNNFTLSTVQAYLADRLYDTTNQFWSLDELNLYINEALQTWNALTNFWRGDFLFNTQQAVTWYDLTDTTNLPNTLRSYNTTFSSLTTIINYHLLEPPTGSVSKQINSSAITSGITLRSNELLSDTACTVNPLYTPATARRILLPNALFDVRRVAYLPAMTTGKGYGSGSYNIGPYGVSRKTGTAQNTVLWREDTYGEQAFNTQYTTAAPGLPSTFLMSTQPPVSFDTDCPPGYGGQYEVLYTQALGSATTIPVPDDWTHVIKWGALAYILSTESNAKDTARAQYCDQRYKLGIKLLQGAAALLAMRINNEYLQIDSVTSGDQYNAQWQAQSTGRPKGVYQSGLNLFAFSPVPWDTYSAMATVVQNAPLPDGANPDTSYVQVSQEVLDVILDYAQHIASFKMGGAEFVSTMPLFQRFLMEAAVYNSKLKEMAEYTTFLLGISQQDENDDPRLDPEVLANG